ncbi:MAG TPA: hypothetical protein ENK06_13535, partial [Gammaproteobacteria bacterium]|nr:hypothetical protein [Gammaproteobacteria bacterium]
MSVNLARQLSFNLVDDFELPKAANVAFKKRYSPLWLCLHFPQLALNLHELETGSPRLVVEEVKNRYVIHSACNMANELGIRSGMTLSSAHALCDDLTVYPRDKAQEKKALEKIADWAQQFTPTVSLVFDGNCVLLEIRASLLLFDGLLALQQTLLASLEKNYPYMVNLAVAP